ncbi:MAG: exodeoxyribonuclease V subunit gamma [Thermoleophilaceae bacterium]
MLHIHRSERADGLVDALRDLMVEPLSDPFAPEVIAVPTRGMERWLTQRMSAGLGVTAGRADGICANVDFPSPRRLVGDAVAAVSGIDPAADGWLPERMVWPLLDVVDACLREPWLRTLAAHLGSEEETTDPARRARRFSTVRHLAELFDRYALHRPEMVRAWAEGRRHRRRRPRPPGRRRLAGRAVAAPATRASPSPVRPSGWRERARACARSPSSLELPQRVSLFGLTRLPAGHLQVLRALSAGRDVHLFLLHPSPALWERVAEETQRTAPPWSAAPRTRPRPSRPTACCASWGRDARELQLVVGGDGDHVDDHRPVEHDGDTLLARIQADVRADRPPPGPPLAGARGRAARRSTRTTAAVQVHACHGRARQVEVVRDAILHVLDEDPSLEPRDVIVMCPDIETFAPLIQATFGAGEVVGRGRRPRRSAAGGPPARPAGPARRPRAAPDQPGARRRRPAARPRRGAADRLPGARPGRSRAGPAALPLRRRRPRAGGGLGLRERHPLGPRRRAPRAVQARQPRRRHLAHRPRPRARGRRDERGRPAAVRGRPSARRRRERVDRPRRALRGARRPAARVASTR